MTDDLVKGKTILSCGHKDEHGCWGVSVQFDDEQCVAGEGFVPTTVYAQYCHECAIKLYYELGKDAGRIEAGLQADRIEAQAAEIEKAMIEGAAKEREAVTKFLRGDSNSDYCDPQHDIGLNLSYAIEDGRHLKGKADG